MEKKTKELKAGDMVRNILDNNYYPLECVETSGSGYLVHLTPAHKDGNTYAAEYADRHTVQA